MRRDGCMKQLTREEMLQRFSSEDNLINVLHRRDWTRQANGNGNNGRAGKFTRDEKEAIVVLADEIGNKETAELVGCNKASIPYFKNGIDSHRSEVNCPSTHADERVIERVQDKISERAIEKVLQSIDLIDDTRLKACNAVELASVAQRLSNVGSLKKSGIASVNVNIITPQVRTESQFETLTIVSSGEGK